MKQVEFFSEKVLEEVCDITGNFWQTQVSGTHIYEDQYFENGRIRVMRISHSMSLMSYGEDYQMTFERLPDKINQTKITISVSLSFGFGAQWKKPSDILKKWALSVGVEPIDFGTKPFIITWVVICAILASIVVVPIVIITLL
ncbi:MAG: hypothetical protein FK733_14580 [Asgard group archaeon]|nr:hypothetical protein [Asgard group archaeon]